MIWFAYFMVNFFSGILDIFKVRQRSIILFIVLVNILLVIGLRYKIGVDWVVYEDLYNGNPVNVPLETGYTYLSYLFSITGLGFWGFVFAITFFSSITLYQFFNTYTSIAIFALTYYFLISFAFNIDFLRQIIAVSITIWSVIFYIRRKYLLSLVLVMLAVSMHSSAIVFLLLPLINTKIFRSVILYLLLAGFALAIIGQYPVDWVINFIFSVTANPFIYKIKVYTTGANVSQTITFNLIFKLIVLFVFLLNRRKIIAQVIAENKLKAFNIILSLFYFMLCVDIYLGKYGAIRLRLDEYFQPYFVLLICLIITMIRIVLVRQLMIGFVFAYVTVNIGKFSQDSYFIKQFSYSNSLKNFIVPDKEFDITRGNEVKEHWAERDKIIIDE
jgi:hypothetical protein